MSNIEKTKKESMYIFLILLKCLYQVMKASGHVVVYKGNNKITELRTILQSQQPENCENRNDPGISKEMVG